MEKAPNGTRPLYRVWAATYTQWHPAHLADVPPHAKAIKPLDEACLNAVEAQVMVESFNEQVLDGPDPVWAVAVPISIRYDGDAEAGSTIQGHHFSATDALQDTH